MELQRPIDKHSKRLISRNIELLLDYCMRFYERQFITRSESNKSVLVKFETLLDDYFQSDKLQTDGLPSVKYFADKVFLSPNYFGDLIKKETGKKRTGIYPEQDDRLSQGDDCRNRENRQPDCL